MAELRVRAILRKRSAMRRLLAFAALLFVLPAHVDVTIEWVTVGDPGNACDTQSDGCYGAVGYTHQISK